MSGYTPKGTDATLYKQIRLIDEDVDAFIDQYLRPKPRFGFQGSEQNPQNETTTK